MIAQLLARAHKLKGRSPAELRARTMQALHARLERASPAARGREPDDGLLARALGATSASIDVHSLLSAFRERSLCSAFAGLSDPRVTAAAVGARWPAAADAVITHADRITSGQLVLCGQLLFFGATPDWTLEMRSGLRVPKKHWSSIDYLNPSVAGDCKLTWELNRQQHLLTLARAYAITGEERYAESSALHLRSWMDANPPKLGINWTSSLELAFRAIAWVWTLSILRSSSHLDAALFARVTKYLYVHGQHLERYLSTYFSPNTHLTGEALGLLYLGSFFPELVDGSRWRETGARILENELERQILNDGVYFEQATYYHRYTTDFYIHALILAQSNGLPLADAIPLRLGQLLDHLTHITRPDGTSPLIGDDDGGRLAHLGERSPNDFRDTLAVGAILLGRRDCAFVADGPHEEACWLLGPAAIPRLAALAASAPTTTSRAFEQSGYFIMRDAWSRTGNYALVRCGLHGALSGGHAHADALSVELVIRGRPILVDSGTYTYTASIEERNRFRSSAAHNTLTLDGASSSEPDESPFRWRSIARSTLRAWMTHSSFDFFEGELDGYDSLSASARHQRALLFLKPAGYWVMRDRVAMAGSHRVGLHFHWASGLRLEQRGDRSVVVCAAMESEDRPVADLHVLGDAGRFSCGREWISPSYGSLVPAESCAFDLEMTSECDVVTVMAPAGTISWENARITTTRGSVSGAILPTDGAHDTLFIGRGDELEYEGVRTDARWLWMRRTLDGEVSHLVAIGGRSLEVDGATLLRSEVDVPYAVGARHDGGLRLHVQDRAESSGRDSRDTRGGGRERACAAFAE